MITSASQRTSAANVADSVAQTPGDGKKSLWQYQLLLAAVFCVAFGLRAGITAKFQGLTAPPDAESNPDQIDYESFAHQLSIGNGYVLPSGEPSACRAPGTAITLLPVYAITGRSFFWGRLWWCLLSALTCVATAEVARWSFGPATGLISSLWLALYPGHFYYSMHYLSEVPFCLYLILACGFTVLLLKQGGWLLSILAGLFWGFATLTRPQILPVVPLGFAVAVLAAGPSRWSHLKQLAMASTVLLAVTSPWLVRNAVVMGKPTFCTVVGGYGFWYGNNELVLNSPKLQGTCANVEQLIDALHPLQGSELQREAAAWRYGLSFVAAHWPEMPRLCLMKIWRLVTPFGETSNQAVYWAFATSWIITAPFMIVGIGVAFRRSLPAACVFVMPLLAMLVVTVVFYGLDRYRDGLVPIIAIFAGVAAVEIANQIRRLVSAGDNHDWTSMRIPSSEPRDPVLQ